MLEGIDLGKKFTKEEYKSIMPDLQLKLAALQRKAKEKDIPIIIVFEGWDTAGKGALINELVTTLDPRGFYLHASRDKSEDDKDKPYLWKVWPKIPARGRMTIFEKSWYNGIINSELKGNNDIDWVDTAGHLNNFERQLHEDGYVIIKLFLHIGKKEQRKRLEALQEDPDTSWVVTKDMVKRHKKYDELVEIYEKVIEKTDSGHAPWTVIEATNHNFAKIKIFNTIIEAIEKMITESDMHKIEKASGIEVLSNSDKPDLSQKLVSSILDNADLTKTVEYEEYNAELNKMQKRMRELQLELSQKRIPTIVVYEGWDAAGKGGNIRRLARALDPRFYHVIPISAPTQTEKAHHYLWRFWLSFPENGYLTIFDRSWYGRVLVERIENFCSSDEWRRAYSEINDMEEQLTDAGANILKFWLHVDKETQLQRFEERVNNPEKSWKITDEDWRNREKWDLYKDAVDEMLFRTSTTNAPWTVVESNNKYYARLKTLSTIIESTEKRLGK